MSELSAEDFAKIGDGKVISLFRALNIGSEMDVGDYLHKQITLLEASGEGPSRGPVPFNR